MQISTWTHPTTGETRRYINGWHEVAGIEVERYGTGNIRSAYYKGERFANGRAGHVFDIKVWLGEDDVLHIDRVSPRLEKPGITADAILDDIEAAVRELAKEVVA